MIRQEEVDMNVLVLGLLIVSLTGCITIPSETRVHIIKVNAGCETIRETDSSLSIYCKMQ